MVSMRKAAQEVAPTDRRFRRTGWGVRRTLPAGSPSGRRGRRPANPVKRTTETDSMTTAPELTSVPLADVLPPRPGTLYCTKSIDQWDETIAAFWDLGAVLLELDDEENIVATYQKENVNA